jgi:hypothetical protein
LVYLVYDHWSLYHVHGYVSEDGYMQLGFLSKTDQGMQGTKPVRQGAGDEVPLVDEHYDIFAWLKAGRVFVVVAS